VFSEMSDTANLPDPIRSVLIREGGPLGPSTQSLHRNVIAISEHSVRAGAKTKTSGGAGGGRQFLWARYEMLSKKGGLCPTLRQRHRLLGRADRDVGVADVAVAGIAVGPALASALKQCLRFHSSVGRY